MVLACALQCAPVSDLEYHAIREFLAVLVRDEGSTKFREMVAFGACARMLVGF